MSGRLEGRRSTSTIRSKICRYRYIEGIGQEVIIDLWMTACCGIYEMTMDRSKKTRSCTHHGGLTLYEQMGIASKANRFTTASGAIGLRSVQSRSADQTV